MKSKNAPPIIITSAVVFFVAVIILAQLQAPQSYSWTQNTVSELAAQGYDGAWIMQMGLIGYGIILGVGIVLRLTGTTEFIIPDLLVMAYGAGIFLSGMFASAPFVHGLPFSVQEASLHSLFATAAGLFISIAMVSYSFAEGIPRRSIFHFGSMIMVVVLSASFGLAENGSIAIGKGILQRAMYVFGLTWVFVNYGYFRRAQEAEDS